MTSQDFDKQGREYLDKLSIWINKRQFITLSDFIATAGPRLGELTKKGTTWPQLAIEASKHPDMILLFKKGELATVRRFSDEVERYNQRHAKPVGSADPSPAKTQERADARVERGAPVAKAAAGDLPSPSRASRG